MAFTGAGVDPGNSPTLVVAVEQIAGLDFQAIKIVDGTPGSTTPVGTSANPLHVADADTLAQLVAIEATLTAGISITDAATAALLALANVSPGLFTNDPTTRGTLTSGNQKTQIVNGANTASVSASGNLGAILATGDNVAGRVKMTDGTNVAAVKPASSAAIATDPALVVSISPNTQPTVLISGATLDGATFTPGAGTAFRGALYVVDETAGSTVAEDALGLARMDSKRAQVLVIEDATTRGQRAAVDANGNQSVSLRGGPSIGNVPVSITATASSTVFAGSLSVKERTFQNDSDQDLLIGFGVTVTATSYHVRVRAGGGFYSTAFSGSVQVMMTAAPTVGLCLAGQMTG